MSKDKELIKFFENLDNKFYDDVTTLSKTNSENIFINDDTKMISGDKLAKELDGDNYASVDAIDLSFESSELKIYFIEFKKKDYSKDDIFPKDKLKTCIDNMKECQLDCEYVHDLQILKDDLKNKELVLLKTKPLETIIILYHYFKRYNKQNCFNYFLTQVKKYYFIVSETKQSHSKNRSHEHLNNRKQNFSFLDKMKPFPFFCAEHINESVYRKFFNNNL